MPCVSARSRCRARATRPVLALMLMAAGLPGWLPAARAGTAAPASLCRAGEAVAFSCPLGQRTVSLCLREDAGEISALSFRLGSTKRLEREYSADATNGHHFSATVSPAHPGANVRQVWFEQDGRRTLLTECVGGNCAAQAGLAELRRGRLISQRRCLRGPDDSAWFSRQLVNFGSDADSSQSKTPLLVIEDLDNGVERLYAPRRR